MIFNVEHVAFEMGFDIFGSVCIFQGIQGILVATRRWRYARNHDGTSVATKGIFQKPSKL